MKVVITPTNNTERLKENISTRVESSRIENGKLIVETDKTEFLEKTPGIDYFEIEGVETEGIGGEPVEKQAYAKLESREDAVKCLLATIEGFDLRILNTEREWDLRQLKKYNPDIKHLKFDKPKDFLEITESISEVEGIEKTDIEIPSEDEVDLIYRAKLT